MTSNHAEDKVNFFPKDTNDQAIVLFIIKFVDYETQFVILPLILVLPCNNPTGLWSLLLVMPIAQRYYGLITICTLAFKEVHNNKTQNYISYMDIR